MHPQADSRSFEFDLLSRGDLQVIYFSLIHTQLTSRYQSHLLSQ